MGGNRSSAFTLIEMLIVVLLVGIMSMSVSFIVISRSIDKLIKGEARNLRSLFEYVRDRALSKDTEYGFSMNQDNTAYQWWLLSDNGHWKIIDTKPLKETQLPDLLVGELSALDVVRYDNAEEGPRIIFFTDTQVMPFSFTLRAKENPKKYLTLKTDGLSRVVIL